LQGDIVKYFPSVDHQILQALLAKHIADRETLWLIERLLASGEGIQAEEYPPIYFPGDDLFAALRPRGLPIGNLTSQFWANVYLRELDMFVKHELRCPAYLRFMDDFVLFADDKDVLHGWKEAIRAFLASRLRPARRRAAWRPPARELTGWLERYAAMVTSGSEGAVLK
jgi:RNA-directed DNA polymerase